MTEPAVVRGLAAHAGDCPNKGLQVRALLAHYCAMMAASNDSRGWPYGDDEWQAILAAGDAVDDRLKAGDVRLSVGGEPTFVALDDAQAPEWNIDALGPTKRVYADKLARRLRERLAPGGLLHYGQGKWYPGEQTARWAFAIYWRTDGVALWQDPALIADETPARAANIDDATRFAAELGRRLGLAPDSAIAAYEDWAHFVLIEQKLPLGVTPEDDTLDDSAQRQRLVRVLDQGLRPPVGYVLPLIVTTGDGGRRRFITERWAFRRGYLFLVPGDSPIGLRLPLGSLPEITFLDFPSVLPADPFAEPRKLPSGPELLAQVQGEDAAAPAAAQQPTGVPALVRTALAIEPRGGHLCVFLPPLADGADYAALIAAIEATAAKTRLPVRLEGYAPPDDARLRNIKVTPDPGVIEVNVHPATAWRDAVEITTTVYEEARAIGLGAGKFTLDGRHVGTGGGNHIVLGALRPADSPFLRRPDLLASLIAYWQNHPSLSYLFSGLFVGPTSQAPRVDEARHDSLYELEIALRRVPEPGGTIAPWLVDRLFRNLLVDLTGNTHRAEICVDKLYAPEGPMGRLGLVELRAFEMPPHARMSLAEQLLVRAPWRGSGSAPIAASWCAGARRCTTASCCRASSGRTSSASSPSCRAWAWRSMPAGSGRTSSSAFPGWARSRARACRSSCGRRWSPGWCWARRADPAGRRG